MKRLPALYLLVSLAVYACSKDDFPDGFTLIGDWLENTSSADKTGISFKTGNRVYLMLAGAASADTLRYRLDKDDELQLFEPDQYPDGKRTYHTIAYSKKKEELTIYSLYPDVEGTPSKTVFKHK